MVKDIEEFSVELKAEAVTRGKSEIFERADIPRDERRPIERPLTDVAGRPEGNAAKRPQDSSN